MLGQELVECKDNCLYIKDDRGKKFKRKAKHLTRVRITNYVKFGGVSNRVMETIEEIKLGNE